MNDQLAQAILDYDEAYEGPIDSAMEVDAEAWQAWIEMARERLSKNTST